MKQASLAVLAACLAMTVPAYAADDHAHHGHGASQAKADAPAIEPVDGQVQRVNKSAGKLTIKHGPIKHMDMPAMTMEFKVRDAATIASLKRGDHIRFKVEDIGGEMTITEIEPGH